MCIRQKNLLFSFVLLSFCSCSLCYFLYLFNALLHQLILHAIHIIRCKNCLYIFINDKQHITKRCLAFFIFISKFMNYSISNK